MNIEFQGQTCVALELPHGDRAIVSLFGAQVLSWKTSEGTERLYLSPKARFDGRSAIRGGIPICFPQFNQRVLEGRALPKHGFARTLTWSVVDSHSTDAYSSVTLGLTQDALTEELRNLWPFKFGATLLVRLERNRLQVNFEVRNLDNKAWPFALALHSYFKLPELFEACLSGLQGVTYWDALSHLKQPEKVQAQIPSDLRFTSETDRVYHQAPASLALKTPPVTLTIEQSASFSETVVWNPGAALCAQLADMPADGYRHMLCVEAAKINDAVLLAPNSSWQGSQTLSI